MIHSDYISHPQLRNDVWKERRENFYDPSFFDQQIFLIDYTFSSLKYCVTFNSINDRDCVCQIVDCCLDSQFSFTTHIGF